MTKIGFLTSTRADYGKLKALIRAVERSADFEPVVYVTGMHFLVNRGSTYREVGENHPDCIKYCAAFCTDELPPDKMLILTLSKLGAHIDRTKPDLLVVHGDRIEALAGTIAAVARNIRVAHVEGGEISGTLDESVRHAVTKLAHIHLVANQEAWNRVRQLGEPDNSIHVIGSPDIDLMFRFLPSLDTVIARYSIPFEKYCILLYHPVPTMSTKNQRAELHFLLDGILESERNFVVIYPNNDVGGAYIIEQYQQHLDSFCLRPSMRFEYFLTLLKHAQCIIGNSSAGIREAPLYGVPSVDVGIRQQGRGDASAHIAASSNIKEAIDYVIKERDNLSQAHRFGDGRSAEHFMKLLESGSWMVPIQKQFVDLGV